MECVNVKFREIGDIVKYINKINIKSEDIVYLQKEGAYYNLVCFVKTAKSEDHYGYMENEIRRRFW